MDSNCNLGQFFQDYQRNVRDVCKRYLSNREDIEDVVMDVFVYLIETARKQEIRNIESWLNSVARNCCRMLLRQASRHYLILKDPQKMQRLLCADAEIELIDKLHLKKRRLALIVGMSLLNEPQRRCLELFYLENFSYREIATATKLPLRAVKSHIQSGKRRLKKVLKRVS